MNEEIIKTNEAEDRILDLIFQHCHIEEGRTVFYIFHDFLSANECACAFLARRGILKPKRREAYYSLSRKYKI